MGGSDADFVAGTKFIAGLTLDDLVGADAGLRATSYGVDGQGSLKMVADYCPPPPPEEDNFPEWPQDISHVVLYFEADDFTFDTKPSPDGDGFFTVKIDEVPGTADDDLDEWIDDALQYLRDNDFIGEDTVLLGAAIKGGSNQETTYFAIDGDPQPDDFPPGSPLPAGPADVIPGASIDLTIEYNALTIV